MKYLSVISACIIALLSNAEGAIYNGLDFGVPEHSIGYSDKNGYVLYTEKFFDLNLIPDEGLAFGNIPIRSVFYTSNEKRRSLLFKGSWNISIIDSFVAQVAPHKYLWQAPDTNLLYFYKSPEKNGWASIGSAFTLTEEKNGAIIIRNADKTAPTELAYKNGRLAGITLVRDKKTLVFTVRQRPNSVEIFDPKKNRIFSIARISESSPEYDFKVEITDKENKVELFAKEIFLGESKHEMIVRKARNGQAADYRFSHDKTASVSRMDYSNGNIRKFIEWDAKTGIIKRDSFGSYATDGNKISKKYEWGSYAYSHIKSIITSESDAYKVTVYRIPRNLTVLPRRIVVEDKINNSTLRDIRYLYDPLTCEIKEIKPAKKSKD